MRRWWRWLVLCGLFGCSTAPTTSAGQSPAEPPVSTTTTASEPAVMAESATITPAAGPLPAQATVDQTDAIMASLLGPTDDAMGQLQRIAPDTPDLPTAPDAVIVSAAFDIRQIGPSSETSARVRYNTPSAPDTVIQLYDSIVASDHPDWIPVATLGLVPGAAESSAAWDIPGITNSTNSAGWDLEIKASPETIGGEVLSVVAISYYRGPTDDNDPTTWQRVDGWRHLLPVPPESILQFASVSISNRPDEQTVRYTLSTSITPGWTETVPTQAQLLTDAGLSPERPLSPGDNEDNNLMGHPDFPRLTMSGCCLPVESGVGAGTYYADGGIIVYRATR